MIAERIYDMLPQEWPLVIGDLPAAKDVVVGIMEYDGEMSTEYFGTRESSSIYGPIIKVVIRHKDYAEGQQRAEQTKRILHRYHDDTLLSIMLVGSPIYLGRSPEKLHEFQVSFRTQVKE